MAKVARWVHQLILLVFGVGVLARLDADHHEPGIQPPAVLYPDDVHGDSIATVNDNRPGVEQAPPPVVPSPAAWDWNQAARSFRRSSRYHRAHPSYYSTPPDNTAEIWYAAEQVKVKDMP